MGMIMSCLDAVERIRFTAPKKGRVYNNCDVVVLQKTQGGTGPDVALIKLPNGHYTVCGSRHSPNGNWAVGQYGLDRFDKSVLSSLVRMGALTPDEVDQHILAAERAKEKSQKHHAKKLLEKACAELGIENPLHAKADQ